MVLLLLLSPSSSSSSLVAVTVIVVVAIFVVLVAVAVVVVVLVVAGYFRNQVREDEMDVTRDRYGSEVHTEFWWGSVKEGDVWRKTDVHGK
jgi:hypothetical protein